MSDLPAPLVPPIVDLRGMPFMHLDVVRLLDSDLFALSTGDEFKAAVALWCKSWLQHPGASLPADDRILAHLSGAGPRWKKVKDMALRGWVECADGRFYHPVVAEKAIGAWTKRLEQRQRTEAAREAKLRAKRQTAQNDCDNGLSRSVTESVTESVADIATSSKGEGEGEGERKKEDKTSVLSARAPRACRLPIDWFPDETLQSWTIEGDPAKAWPGITAAMMAVEIEKFRDYWHAKPGKDAAKLDWPATWRGWVRKAVADLELRPRSAPAVRRDNGWL